MDLVLADTSVWITHLRLGHPHLEKLLEENGVSTHPFVIGELACGNLRDRKTMLELLHTLERSPVVGHEELMFFIEKHKLMGIGLGFVDVNLLASARLSGYPLWTEDKRLKEAAVRQGVAYAGPASH